MYSKTSWDTDKCPKNIQCFSNQCILRYMAIQYCVKMLQNQCPVRLTLCSKSTVYLKYQAVEPSCYSRSILHQNPIFSESFQLATFSFSIFASIFEVLQYFKTTLRKDEIYIFLKNECNSLTRVSEYLINSYYTLYLSAV